MANSTREAQAKTRSWRLDAAHDAPPILAMLPNLREVLAETTPARTEASAAIGEALASASVELDAVLNTLFQADTPSAEDVQPAVEEPNDVAPEICSTAESTEPETALTPEGAPASEAALEPPPIAKAAPSPFTKISSAAGKVPDRIFWGAAIAVLIVASAMIYLGRSRPEPEFADDWNNGYEWSSETEWQSSDPAPIGPADGQPRMADASAHPLHQQGESQVNPRMEVSPAAFDGVPTSRAVYPGETPTALIPHEPGGPLVPGLIGSETHSHTLPSTEVPGVARLQGIIEQPDLRARNDRTESSLH